MFHTVQNITSSRHVATDCCRFTARDQKFQVDQITGLGQSSSPSYLSATIGRQLTRSMAAENSLSQDPEFVRAFTEGVASLMRPPPTGQALAGSAPPDNESDVEMTDVVDMAEVVARRERKGKGREGSKKRELCCAYGLHITGGRFATL